MLYFDIGELDMFFRVFSIIFGVAIIGFYAILPIAVIALYRVALRLELLLAKVLDKLEE